MRRLGEEEMSISKQVTVWCDGCVRFEQMTGTVADARKELRTKCWKSEGGKDYCPLCVAKGLDKSDDKETTAPG